MAYWIIQKAIDLYSLALLASVIISWVAPGSSHPFVRFIHRVTEPVLAVIRKALPSAGGFDFSPMIALIALQLIERFLLH